MSATIDRALWILLAVEYADRRWCWTDHALIEEMALTADLSQRPDEWIDRKADHFDLNDPIRDWGPLSDAKSKSLIVETVLRIDEATVGRS